MSAARAGAPLPEAVGLLRAVVVDGLLRDVALADGRIAAIGPTGSVPAGPGDTVDGAGRVPRPAFVEPPLHLDKALLGTPQGGGTLADAIAKTARRKAAFTHDDVIARADAVLHRAVSHGTVAVRVLFFQQGPEGKTNTYCPPGCMRRKRPARRRGRMAAHEAECVRLVGLGATRLRRDGSAPVTSAGYGVAADPEGTEFCWG
ncbi:VOC family protein [Streptomyces mirabilis]|uniref:VOC family protein n=1 Tax=Streptomyces TaxID=1883 RepID=UPI000BD2C8F0|nr:VOC family protein [Streptomyces sp. OK228]SOE33707.1 hypothetical protein SAMN05442782_10774 [Streptomyces sp. OK228]